MEVCYTKLGNLRALDINISDDKITLKYLCSYSSREKDLPILLRVIDKKDNIIYYKEYYTGSIIMGLDNPEKVFMELNPNSIDKKINNVPYLAISKETVNSIDNEFINDFYYNEQLNKIDSIIENIDYLVNKTQNNIRNYIINMERLLAFKCYENAYLDNAIYDLEKGISYKMKRKVIDKR